MRRASASVPAKKLSCKGWKRLLAAVLLVLLIASLLPLYSAARYSYAGVDDYRYGRTTHAVWEETRSLAKTVAEAFHVATETYTTWQGSVAAIFLMALQPGIFGAELYGLSTVFLLSVFVLAVLCFVLSACKHALHADTESAIMVAALAAICCVQFVPTPVESYYWFNGGVYYTFFFSLSLFTAALLLRRTRKKTALQCVVLPVLMAFLGLGNLITGLLCCTLLAAYGIVSRLLRRRDPLLWALLLVLFAAFAVNVLSPGNAVRQAENAEKARGVFPAIWAALGDAVIYAGQWLRTPTPFVCLLPIPLYWRMAESSGIRFRFPALVTFVSLLLLAAGFTPNEYALGFAGEARIIDIQYYMFVFLLMLNVLWYTGWAQSRIKASARALRTAAISVVVVSAIAACTITLSTRNSASASAILAQTGGKAQSYADTWERRIAILEAPAQAEVILPKLTHQPPLLCMVDIAPTVSDPFYFYNEQLAAYYGKASVLRAP